MKKLLTLLLSIIIGITITSAQYYESNYYNTYEYYNVEIITYSPYINRFYTPYYGFGYYSNCYNPWPYYPTWSWGLSWTPWYGWNWGYNVWYYQPYYYWVYPYSYGFHNNNYYNWYAYNYYGYRENNSSNTTGEREYVYEYNVDRINQYERKQREVYKTTERNTPKSYERPSYNARPSYNKPVIDRHTPSYNTKPRNNNRAVTPTSKRNSR